VEIDGNDVWVGTSKGVGWGSGSGYYKGLKARAAHKAGKVRTKAGGLDAHAVKK
jgi:hypothetical protein